MQGVTGPRLTELPTRHLPLDFVVAHGVDAGCRDGVDAAGDLEEHVGRRAGGEVEARDAAARGDGQRDGDGGRPELDLIATGCGVLLRVRERRDGRLGGGADRTDGGEDRDVLVGGAAGAAEMREAEAADVAVGVGVPAAGLDGIGAGVGAPLHHPEGDVGPGELAHGSGTDRSRARAVEGLHLGRRVAGRRRCAGLRRAGLGDWSAKRHGRDECTEQRQGGRHRHQAPRPGPGAAEHGKGP